MSETLPQPRRARRSWRAVALMGVIALGLAACSSSSESAVTVGDKTVDEATVNTELAEIAKNPQLKDQAAKQGKVTPEVTAAWLTTVIETEVAKQGVEKAGTKITKADTTAAQSWADGYFGAATAFAAFPKAFRDAAVARYANVSAFVRTHTKPPTEAEVRAAYDTSLVKNCASQRFVSHILVADEATALAAEAELAAGTDFKDVAAKRSTDTQSKARGGALGCIDGQQLDPTFAAAANATPIGQVSAPVKTQFGYHVIKVEDVSKALPFDSVKNEIRSDLVEQGPAGIKALATAMAVAKVKIASRYGRWVVKDGHGAVQPKTVTTTTTKPPASSSSTTTTKP
jgi:parvulin-like peptidyl-prolyl isomerase